MSATPNKLTINIDPELHHRLKVVAVQKKTTITAILTDCAEKVVQADSESVTPPDPQKPEP